MTRKKTHEEEGIFPLNGNGGRSTSKMVTELVALILGVAAIITPMYQGLQSLSGRLEDINSHGTPPTNTKIAAMEVSFTEIETQFRNLNERTERMEKFFNGSLESLDSKLQLEIAKSIAERGQSTDPRIAVLEREMADLRDNQAKMPTIIKQSVQ